MMDFLADFLKVLFIELPKFLIQEGMRIPSFNRWEDVLMWCLINVLNVIIIYLLYRILIRNFLYEKKYSENYVKKATVINREEDMMLMYGGSGVCFPIYSYYITLMIKDHGEERLESETFYNNFKKGDVLEIDYKFVHERFILSSEFNYVGIEVERLELSKRI